MTFQNPHKMSSFRISSHPSESIGKPARKSAHKSAPRLVVRLGSGLAALMLSLGTALPTLAADPFRANTSTDPHTIGPLTEKAFKAIFESGDYESAREFLEQAETAEADEPLVHAMMASMSYLSGDFEGLLSYAQSTKTAAETLKTSDPLRGHLYTAVGTFLEGAHLLKTQGVARGTPTALSMLQTVFSELDEAENIAPNDPELNLLKGYMDLMLAVNLPFSNPEEAISRMSAHGNPVYLTQRGIAVGYRDLGDYDQALAAVGKAITAAPKNPELLYLKAQLLAKQGEQSNSVALFDEALTYADQLPTTLVKQITWEGCVAEGLPGGQCETLRNQAVGAF
jgi:tetratricopeptide (TPR) repeat protein